jgi:hypothetical protein
VDGVFLAPLQAAFHPAPGRQDEAVLPFQMDLSRLEGVLDVETLGRDLGYVDDQQPALAQTVYITDI